MTELGEEEVGVLLVEAVQKVARLVARELLPLPIPFPENEVVESERIRGLSRAVRSRANAGVRSMTNLRDAYRWISAAECTSTAEAFKALCGSVPGYTGIGCQTGYLQGGPRLPARPRREDGRWLCSCNRSGLRSLEGLAPGIASIAKRVPGSVRA